MTPVLVVIAIVVVAIAAAVALTRRARARDGVDSFRRQIDALSPEARRPTIDQVQRAASDDEPAGADDEDDTDGT